MDVHRKGALAAAFGSRSQRLKVVLLGGDGGLIDLDGKIIPESADPSAYTGRVLEITGPESQLLAWSRGPLTDGSPLPYSRSSLAMCTCKLTRDGTASDVYCLLYQAIDGQLVLRTYGRTRENDWDDGTCSHSTS
jgi:hypothetical protein